MLTLQSDSVDLEIAWISNSNKSSGRKKQKNEPTELKYCLFDHIETFLSTLFRCDQGSVVMLKSELLSFRYILTYFQPLL